ncbi:exodeoxyribonuclease V subunit alpha [Nocardioides donggukensis]|uniref:RecBCD enzyme subunit RecD n=1 Tax=Nocardioides donggukensis TaxID=2774019 RepID=A0A927PZW1_9ACTN|nr:exodeoxyribonuclease V subunit alpha [Nocardioides donggukensis]MBD8868127.1 exodeoxyribonuclease V subunit alpha [Nocardioides donggukensis]
MSELFTALDEQDPRLALRATGLLGRFNRAGLVTSADCHLARTLGALVGEADESVLLAVALTSRAVRGGSVCLELGAVADLTSESGDGPVVAAPGDADASGAMPAALTLPEFPELPAWADAVAGSRLVAQGVLRWEDGLLYLDRYHEQETQVIDDLAARARSRPDPEPALLERSLARVFPGDGFAEQRDAARTAAHQRTTVLTGGPGTGKTTAVAGLLVALVEQAEARGERLRVALTAPTGKAAARLQEAVTESAGGFTADDRERVAGLQASTLHRLLRRHPGNSTRFRHHRGNRLPHDVVVVDESSMVSLTMMARLLEAVRPEARLVLVGDPDQLSSVEAGAVLSDLVRGYRGRPDSPVVALRTGHRYGARIGALADALRRGDADAAVEVLAAGHDEVEWVTDDDPSSALRRAALPAALAVRDAALAGDADRALAALDRHRLLCAHREGPAGVRHWNRRIEQWLTAETGDPLFESAYLGRPLLVTANDYRLGVYNGDSGVVVSRPEGRRVVLRTGTEVLDLAPSRLGDVETMHALTIHKSQGSQADEVTVLLPDEESRLLTRELFYTAVTRARQRVRVVGDEQAVRAAIARRAQRASGLGSRLGASPDARLGRADPMT